MRNLSGRISTPSMAVALTALFIALSGTAIALPGKNRVDKNDFKRGSVGSRAIANNSIRAGDIRNGTLTGRDVDEGSLEGFQRTGAPAFTPAALQNGWGAFSDTGHWTDGEGTVHIQGAVAGGNGRVFTLPPESRPRQAKVFSVPCVGGVGFLGVGSDGSVNLSNQTTGTNCRILARLDGIEFRTDH